MANKEATKYLQQLYPNGGHCWLDEQRIEAISMAIKALQEEPVSEEFEKALAMEWQGYNERGAAMVDALEDNTQELAFAKGFYRGSKWQEEKDNEEKVLIYKHGFDDCKEHIKEVLLSEVLPCFMHGGEADEVVAKLEEVLNKK